MSPIGTCLNCNVFSTPTCQTSLNMQSFGLYNYGMTSSPLVRILAPSVLRVTHFKSGEEAPANRPWFDDVLLPLENNEKNGQQIGFEVENGVFSAKDAQSVYFFREAGLPDLGIQKTRPFFYFDIPQLAINAGQRRVENGFRLKLGTSPIECFYGWGEWFNGFQRKIGKIDLDNRNALFNNQEKFTYSGLPFFISNRGYGFLLLNSYRSQWTISPGQLTIEADGPNADYILIYGPGMKAILRTYTALTGRPPLIPRWGFGLWVTSYPQEHQDKVLEYVRKHREHEIPLDAVILDYHWEERFHNFRWRQSLIPFPPNLVAGLRLQGVRLGLILTSFLNNRNRPIQKLLLNLFGKNVTPGLEWDDERALDEYNEAKSKGYLAHENVRWWFGAGGMLDFTNPQAVAWWRTKLRALNGYGADFIKNDDGEDLPDDARSSNGMEGGEYHNIYGLYYGRATFEREPAANAPSQINQQNPRALIYARTGWIGSQRYPALFLGDQQATFEGIKRSLRAGLNLSMCGFSYWGADVFGLSGKTTPEIHMRYAQWALLTPVARYFVRPEKIDNTRFPWSHNKKVEANFKKYAGLRMQLLPYYNNLAHTSYREGLPLMRPLVLEFPDEANVTHVEDQIMLGPNLMICPVVIPGALSRKIVLPQGTWHDFWSENTWQGGETIKYFARSDCLPILVKGGTILPMGPLTPNISPRHVFDHLEFHIWPPFPSEGTFYDEDGNTTAYQSGSFSTTLLHANSAGNRMVVGLSGAKGIYQGQPAKRRVELILHRVPPIISVTINGQPAASYNRDWISGISFEQNMTKDTLVLITFRT